MPSFQQIRVVQFQFLRQLRGRNALSDAAKKQNDLGARLMRLTENRSREQVEDRSAFSTSVVHDRRAMPIMRRLIERQRMSVRTFQTVRVQRLKQEVVASPFVQQFINGKADHRLVSRGDFTRWDAVTIREDNPVSKTITSETR